MTDRISHNVDPAYLRDVAARGPGDFHDRIRTNRPAFEISPTASKNRRGIATSADVVTPVLKDVSRKYNSPGVNRHHTSTHDRHLRRSSERLGFDGRPHREGVTRTPSVGKSEIGKTPFLADTASRALALGTGIATGILTANPALGLATAGAVRTISKPSIGRSL